MVHALDNDESVVLMGEDIGVYGGTHLITDGLYDEYGPRRIMDVPISENGFTGAAVGMAMMGMRPIVEMMTWNFSFLAADQIIQNAAKVRYFSGGQVEVPLTSSGAPTAAASSSRPNIRTPWRASTATSPVSRSSRQ